MKIGENKIIFVNAMIKIDIDIEKIRLLNYSRLIKREKLQNGRQS